VLLLLFDIDGTLLSGATAEHADALHAAVHDVHGVDISTRPLNFSPAGRTDGEIARLLLLGAGVSAARIDERADAVREACCAEYARRCPRDLSGTVLPGIPALLERMAAVPGVRLSLLTGNFEPVARLKLMRAGLGHWFATGQGAFGSDSEDRAALPAIARHRGGSCPRAHTLVIGDTPRDIACAHADGVCCAAVATGRYTVAELSDAELRARDAWALREPLEAWIAAVNAGSGTASA
jgi:phosphoglycolate phosphatase-like HAD superfamily hydrolase